MGAGEWGDFEAAAGLWWRLGCSGWDAQDGLEMLPGLSPGLATLICATHAWCSHWMSPIELPKVNREKFEGFIISYA